MVLYGPVVLGEGVTGAVEQLVRRCGQVVDHHHGRCAQIPQRSLESAHQRRERLPEAYLRLPPARVTQNELEQQMSERLSTYHHAQFAAVGEVHLRLTFRRMLLLEVHLSLRPAQCTPVPYPPLQSAQVRCVEPARVTLVQPLQQHCRLQLLSCVPA